MESGLFCFFSPTRTLDSNFLSPQQIIGRQRFRLEESLEVALVHYLAALAPCAWTEIDDVVGVPHHLFVVLNDDDGVAAVAQSLEGRDKPLIVARVEADSRLVEDVEDASEPRANLRREADALHLAAGKCGRRAVESQVVKTDVEKELKPPHDFGDDVLEAGELCGW